MKRQSGLRAFTGSFVTTGTLATVCPGPEGQRAAARRVVPSRPPASRPRSHNQPSRCSLEAAPAGPPNSTGTSTIPAAVGDHRVTHIQPRRPRPDQRHRQSPTRVLDPSDRGNR